MITRPCSSCGALIGFVETPTGRAMPVDPDLVKTFVYPDPRRAAADGERALVLITERGTSRRGVECSLTVEGADAVEGYVPHWSTCTDPARHRKE